MSGFKIFLQLALQVYNGAVLVVWEDFAIGAALAVEKGVDVARAIIAPAAVDTFLQHNLTIY